jgi:hypothetical protein
LDRDAALDKHRAGLVDQYKKTKHRLVEDVSLVFLDAATASATKHKDTKQELEAPAVASDADN